MLHNNLNRMMTNAMEISQQASMKWQQEEEFQQQILTYLGGGNDEVMSNMFSPRDMKPENVWSDYDFNSIGTGQDPGIIGIDYTISRTASCPPAMAENATNHGKRKEAIESCKRKKADKNQSSLKAVLEKETRDKKQNGTEQSGNKKNKKESSTGTSKEIEDKKPDYIHVRARRGQATDSHSLAERVRREKISERMKYLQDLVPGCNKITGKAGMLDEIINYVQSLQRQVEFLSMKLAAVNPTLDSFYTKEIFEVSGSNYPAIGVSTEMVNPSHLQFNSLPQCSGLENGANASAMALRRTISAPISVQQTLLDSSTTNQLQTSSTWDAEIQNLYAMEFQQGRSTSFFSQPFMGFVEGGNTRMAI